MRPNKWFISLKYTFKQNISTLNVNTKNPISINYFYYIMTKQFREKQFKELI